MRLIDADVVRAQIDDKRPGRAYEDAWALTVLDNAPIVDAVPVVRCRECKWYKEGKLLGPTKFCFRLRDADGERIGYNFASDDFCSHGERRGGAEDAVD